MNSQKERRGIKPRGRGRVPPNLVLSSHSSYILPFPPSSFPSLLPSLPFPPRSTMKPLILLLSLLATQTLAHQQSRFSAHPPVVPHLFPSEIIARTEHAAYQLWRIHHPALLDEQERRLLDAAGVRDMTGYISQMADVSPSLESGRMDTSVENPPSCLIWIYGMPRPRTWTCSSRRKQSGND